MSTARTATIGAVQGCLSVLLTAFYGVVASRFGMISQKTIKDSSTLCVNIFLPALLIVKIGSNISIDNLTVYIPIFIWSLSYTFISLALAKLAARRLHLPSWIVPAAAFNNTTSLPLLLTQSLAETGVLDSIANGDTAAALGRAQSYFLVNSLVSKTATFAIGPRLFGDDCSGTSPVFIQYSDPPSETSSLLTSSAASIYSKLPTTQSDSVKRPNRPIYLRILTLLHPTSWAALFSIIIGLTPALHRLFFASPKDGGYLSAWLTASLSNLGKLFTVLQVFIAGAKLSESFGKGKESRNPPKLAIFIIVMIRFVFWSVVSIPTIYLLATKTNLLSKDPVVWWSMMLMPIGPPAMVLSALLEVANVNDKGKLMVARTLAFMYIVTPLISVPVTGALKFCLLAVQNRT